MPQVQLPVFPEGSTPINAELAFGREGDQVVYWNGHLPVFTHGVEDLASFRLFTTQLIVNHTASSGEIARAFGVPLRTVKRCTQRYRERGAEAFFTPAPKREGRRLTSERLGQVQALLDEGLSVPQVSEQSGVLATTLHKAIGAGRLRASKKKGGPGLGEGLATKGQRSVLDARASLGVATTRVEERVLASLGAMGAAAIRPERVADVPNAGVLCALPALLELGLLRHSRSHFALRPGFYPLETVFLSMAFLALARVPSLEALRFQPQGEWGKILGLDRIPEVKTLRGRLAELSADGSKVQQWSTTLAQEWMAGEEGCPGTLYVDGHVRVYHGSLTPLPRRYVARQKLCLRGTTDYWVNAMDGRPFFVVAQAVDPGMVRMLEESLVPRLLQEVPGQPSAEELAADPWRARFTLVFDRAGYSPDLFRRLREQRIAVVTYHKFPGPAWPREEFVERTVRLVNGEEIPLRLAERGVRLPNGLWLREIRHLDEKDHQTPMLTTDFTPAIDAMVTRLFARWCQENFFQYMRQHYGLDSLAEYGTEPLPDTTLVVNPAWRRADAEVRRERALLCRAQAEFGARQVSAGMEPDAVAEFEKLQGEQLERIVQQGRKLEELKKARKETPRHLPIKDLPQAERFAQLKAARKHLVDTLKLIAYRAETALVLLVREKLARLDDGRALVRELLSSAADLHPEPGNKTLTVRIHRLATAAHDQALQHLCDELNDTETVYPGTDLRLIFEPIGATSLP